ncbi:MAG: hypothetical protein VST67_03965, partial [Nitrospirota bacterium]|nr:hypothetical protein [Nitrospirota bacterium]
TAMVGSRAFLGEYSFLNRGIIQRGLQDYFPMDPRSPCSPERFPEPPDCGKETFSTMKSTTGTNIGL